MAKPKRSQHRAQHGSQHGAQRSSGGGAAGVSRTSTQQSRPVQNTSGTGANEATAARGSATASTRYRPLAAREPQARGAQKRKQAQQAWWQKNATVLIAAGSVVVLVAIFFAIAHFAGGGSAPAGIGSAAPASVLQPLEHPSNSSLYNTVGAGGLPNPFKHANSGGDFLKGPNGKPEFLYAGAEYCPYCAAERWSIVMALSRFGSFTGLKLSASSGSDAFPNTSTFTFVDASYTSDSISFSSAELQDRDSKALQTPTAQQKQILDKYNSSQYFGQSAGGIPFISVANQYITNGSGYQPGILDNLTWQEISDKLSNPSDPVTQDIVGNANWITAAICQTTGQAPASVCKAAPIPDLEKRL